MTLHGSPLLGKGCPTVLIGNMPSWRVGDQHTCPIPNAPPPAGPGTPHGPGITTGIPDGPGLCLIGGQPAARIQDIVTEPGAVVPLPPPNPIQVGCTTVLIGTLAPMPGAPLTPDVCQTEGHPVDVATGRLIEWVTDFERLSPAALIFKRFYDSSLTHSGVFGHGWRHCYEFSLTEMESELELIDEVGRTLRFPKPNPGNVLQYGGMRVEAPAFHEFIVWLQPGKGLHFIGNEWGKLVVITIYDPNGHARHLSYDSAFRLTRVRDHCGHVLEFQYNGERIALILERSCEDSERVRIIAEYQYHSDGASQRPTMPGEDL